MEKFFNSLPKPVLAILVIAAALAFFMFNDPPHTVCDVQMDNLKDDLKGQVFPSVIDKHNMPPLINQAQSACEQGNSAGSCFEYFSILKKLAKDIQNYSSECRQDLASIAEIRKAMREGLTLMVKMAWGSRPPDPGIARTGWLQDSELGLFCQLKDVYTLSFGSEDWNDFRMKITNELPGQPPLNMANPKAEDTPKAIATMNEKDIWSRSIFSVRCENYR